MFNEAEARNSNSGSSAFWSDFARLVTRSFSIYNGIMSGSGARETPFPTRMALTNTKLRLKGAQTGHSLLAKKRDALTTRFRAILRKVDEVRSSSVYLHM